MYVCAFVGELTISWVLDTSQLQILVIPDKRESRLSRGAACWASDLFFMENTGVSNVRECNRSTAAAVSVPARASN